MLDPIKQCLTEYRKTIRDLAQNSPFFAALHDFVNVKQHQCQTPADVTLLTIRPKAQDGNSSSSVEFKNLGGTLELAKELEPLRPSDGCCRLFLVENICPDSIALLGGLLKITPGFFASHMSYTNWHRIDEISDRLPVLPSTRSSRDFTQIMYMELQRCVKQPFPVSKVGWPDCSRSERGGETTHISGPKQMKHMLGFHVRRES
jgi:hypothetical protein